ncbi:ferrous iron transporter B [Arenicella xantha]|uniref:Ferrous iron transport protein B n=1 Tax=Arenicella xantha TaxID=644221 RepID=A0A395JFE2_9GAMM|nr:ferrous iron transporter B [Arenicella xantha]RBP48523.1 ferrous iron transport protein B [Arenicella xantha]
MSSILVVGKPNSGKSLLFNRLTGVNQKVANFPGVTVEIKTASFRKHILIDFPGTYSLDPISKDEQIAVDQFVDYISNKRVKGVLCMLDSTRLERSLVFALQAQKFALEADVPVVFALNMMDEIARVGETVDVENLERDLGCKVYAISTRQRQGLEELSEALDTLATDPELFLPASTLDLDFDPVVRAHQLHAKYGANVDRLLRTQNRLDRFFLSGIMGGIAFVLIMLLLFQSIFTWAVPLMDGVEAGVSWLSQFTTSHLSDGVFKDFLVDAVFGGVGSFLVFVPQIMVLTFIIGLLEDSGYLARASVICHRALSAAGVSGMSFVPYLSGFACAIPAMFAARTIASPKRRLLTILTIPLMSCSARLPVYSLIVLVLIPPTKVLGGLLDMRGVVFFGLYMLGIVAALVVSAMLSKFAVKNEEDVPFILELPPYRLPSFKPLIERSINSAKAFVKKAGNVIFVVTVLVWVLGYFPNGAGNLESSYLGMLGRIIEPIFAPLDLDWRYGVAILASFVAREVFVGTLGTMFGIDGADENIAGLAANVQADGLSMASGMALLVFYVLALQCASTLAVMRKEVGNNRIPVYSFIGYSLLAYVGAVITFQLVTLFA